MGIVSSSYRQKNKMQGDALRRDGPLQRLSRYAIP